MPFIAYNFARHKRRGIVVDRALKYQVMFQRTIVGWLNVYFVDHPDRPRVTLSPQEFHAILPEVSPRVTTGCCEVGLETLHELGFSVDGLAEVAV
ncbi:hypothetical protein KDJ56_14695 [Brevibacillus composti]|uniref:Uncharacterized protein n=1 Tax=Brevibacillus composti TaxID=2796470 RepID=A0A7T5EIH3_9BACL|nr:hypothetical protein [Brevibacillus composti]QQE73167.1 hypothetical protein JD108_14750 [Brevibacillus composti]QUO40246.1 hypothetical protein KDJ56_14695 [Brevibacillus composti]